jgi:hypothetical protein
MINSCLFFRFFSIWSYSFFGVDLELGGGEGLFYGFRIILLEIWSDFATDSFMIKLLSAMPRAIPVKFPPAPNQPQYNNKKKDYNQNSPLAFTLSSYYIKLLLHY